MSNSNSIAMNVPSDDDIMDEVALAFGENAQAGLLKGTAVQRVAFGILAHRDALVEAGKSDVPRLAATVEGKEARATIRKLMAEHFITEPKPMENAPSIAKATRKLTVAAQNTLLARGMLLAGLFDRHDIGYAAFNRDLGQFRVKADLFIGEDEQPGFGRFAQTTVMMDGVGDMIGRKSEDGTFAPATIAASADRFILVNAPRKARDASKGKDGATVECSVVALTAALSAILCQARSPKDAAQGEAKADPVTKDSYNKKTWSELAALAQWYHTTTSAPGFDPKAKAAPVKAAAKKAA
jgi:hypothetical protein